MFLSLCSFMLMIFKDSVDWSVGERLVKIFFKSMKYICFMGIGSLISYVFQRKLLKNKSIVLAVMLMCLYILHLFWNGLTRGLIIEFFSYLLAIVIFTVCYLYQKKIKDNGILGYIGVRSYSLYLVHGVLGYILMYSLMEVMSYLSMAIATTIFFSILAANMFYLLIERLFSLP